MAKNRRDRNSWGEYMVNSAARKGTGPLLSVSGDEKDQRLLGASVQGWEMATAELLPVRRKEPWPRATGKGCRLLRAGPEPPGSPPHYSPPPSIWTAPAARPRRTLWFSFCDRQDDKKAMRVGRGLLLLSREGQGSGVSQPPLAQEMQAPGRAGRAGTMRQSTLAPGGSVSDPSNQGEGTPAWESSSAAVRALIGVLDGEFGKKGSKVVVSCLLPHPDLVPFPGQHYGWHCSLILPFGDIGLMIQHQDEGRGKERLGPVGSRREWVGSAHAGGDERVQ